MLLIISKKSGTQLQKQICCLDLQYLTSHFPYILSFSVRTEEQDFLPDNGFHRFNFVRNQTGKVL